MTNHIHLVAVPKTEQSLSRALHLAHSNYSTYFNAKYEFAGHTWEGRPSMCVLDEPHMWSAIRYVERNPVRAGMVERAEDYLWSSAAAHCSLRDDILLDGDFLPAGIVENWSEWLKIDHTDDDKRAIRLHTFRGSPWCAPEFLIYLERLTGRTLGPQKPGRPQKESRDKTGRLPFS